MRTSSIEVLKCKACGKIAIGINGVRVATIGPEGHGSNKCAGRWLAVAEVMCDDIVTPKSEWSRLTPDEMPPLR